MIENWQEAPQEWIFTFGFGHAYPNGFVRIYGTFTDARIEMIKRYGQRWAFQYATEDEAGVKEYNLYEVKKK